MKRFIFVLTLLAAGLSASAQVAVKYNGLTGRRSEPSTLYIPTALIDIYEAGSTLTVNGTLGGTPTGGTLNLSNLTLTLPSTAVTPGAYTSVNVTVGADGRITAIASGAGGGTWGSITGTLSNQTDLTTALNAKAALASPTFTGTPLAPTAAPDTNTTQLATTAFAKAEADAAQAAAIAASVPTTYLDTDVALTANSDVKVATQKATKAYADTKTTAAAALAAATAIKLDDFVAPDDNTDLNANTSRHGLMPKGTGSTTTFYRSDGTQAVPAGGGDVSGAGDNSFTGKNTFAGGLGRIAATMSSTSIDITKAALNRALTATETESFSATPTTDLQIPVYYTTDGTPRVVTWGVTVYSYDRQADISATGISIPASGTYVVTYNYSLARTRWEISGAPSPTTGTGSVALIQGALNVTTAKTFTVTNSLTLGGTDSTSHTLPATNSVLFANTTKADVLDAAFFAADAGSTDAYVVTLSPAITAYVTGAHYRFKANTANTGAATVAINGLTATTIVKVAGGITTALDNNDIRAGQWVEVVYDGTNMQMQSMLGNSSAATGDVVGPGSSTDNAIARFDSTTGKLIQNSTATVSDNGDINVSNAATVGVAAFNTSDQVTNYDRLHMFYAANVATIQSDSGGSGTARTLALISGTTNTLNIRPGSSTNGQASFVGTNSSTASGVGFRIDLGTWTQAAGNNVGSQVLTVINQSGTAAQTDFQVNRATQTATGSGVQRLADFQVAGTSKFAVSNNGIVSYTGLTRVATQFDKTNTTLADVTGLTATLRAGETYTFQADIPATLDGTGGGKVAIAGTATATSIYYQVYSLSAAGVQTAGTRQTSLGSAVSSISTVTAEQYRIVGTITVNAAGTLTVQFAQNSASGTSSVLVGGTFDVKGF